MDEQTQTLGPSGQTSLLISNSAKKIRGLVLAVHMKGPGENLLRVQAIALSIKARPAASDAQQQVSNWSGVRSKSMTSTVEVVPFIRRREDRRRCES